MWLRLRQIALVAHDIEAVVADLRAVFGLEVAYVDPGVAVYGLENRVLPIGSQFLEVVAPVRDGTAGGRYLERRGGDGGYMVITQCDDHAVRRDRVERLGIRRVTEQIGPDHCIMQLHPRDTGGSFLEIDWTADTRADGAWPPAGDHWQEAVRKEVIKRITAAEIQGPDAEGLAHRWSEILDCPVERDAEANPRIRLENAELRFVADRDGRGEGLGGIDVEAADAPHALSAARDRGVLAGERLIVIGGTRFRVVSQA